MSAAPTARLPLGQILIGDARTRLAELPPASIDTIITSPPYFALRNYGHTKQLGLEPNVDTWVANLVTICRGIARILKPGGSLWLNVADSYSSHQRQGAPKKSLLLGPQRLAMALLQDGWLLRNQMVWAKTNPMPSSVGDRLSCSYEHVLLLVRSQQYFFDLDAIRQALVTTAKQRPGAVQYRYLPDNAIPPDAGFDDDGGLNQLKAEGRAGHPLGKNPGDVWSVPTAAYRGAHFATFPLSLVKRPLLATCPEKVCTRCGTPWQREPVNRHQPIPTLGRLKPNCNCDGGTTPGIVLDPFMGAGTVAVAAEQHGRDWVGVELNAKYAALAKRRIQGQRMARKPSTSKEKHKET